MSIEQKTLNSYISFAEKLIKKSEKIILFFKDGSFKMYKN